MRCERCAVFQPTDDIAYALDGSTYCAPCGPPPVSIPPLGRGKPRSPLAIAAAICGAIFVVFVALAELAS